MPFLSPNQQHQSTERGTERQQKVQFLPPERHLTSTKHCVCVCACVSKSTVQMTWQELFLKEHQFSYVSQHGQPTRVLHLRISHGHNSQCRHRQQWTHNASISLQWNDAVICYREDSWPVKTCFEYLQKVFVGDKSSKDGQQNNKVCMPVCSLAPHIN